MTAPRRKKTNGPPLPKSEKRTTCMHLFCRSMFDRCKHKHTYLIAHAIYFSLTTMPKASWMIRLLLIVCNYLCILVNKKVQIAMCLLAIGISHFVFSYERLKLVWRWSMGCLIMGSSEGRWWPQFVTLEPPSHPALPPLHCWVGIQLKWKFSSASCNPHAQHFCLNLRWT